MDTRREKEKNCRLFMKTKKKKKKRRECFVKHEYNIYNTRRM